VFVGSEHAGGESERARARLLSGAAISSRSARLSHAVASSFSSLTRAAPAPLSSLAPARPSTTSGMLIAPNGIARNVGICIIWFLILCWIFLGVALGADVFMTSIEVITSKEKVIKKKDDQGASTDFHVRIWNATVANLTLMALGSSAPEILLNVVEVLGLSFNSGPLGPSTIVGSAAFNLMIITALCIVCLPDDPKDPTRFETRTIKQQAVFLTTSFYSVFAYIWLLIIVLMWTPEVITVEEGVLTVVLLIILVIQAFWADK
jgi:Ca2+/Na+ antiporter